MNTMDRAAVVRDAQNRMRAQWEAMPSHRGPIGQYCVFWAGYTVEALKAAGVVACVNAGSAFWRVAPDPGDGLGAIGFGYEFEWTLETIRRVIAAELPELHAWVAIPPAGPGDPGQIVDLTAPYIPENARLQGFEPVYQFPEYYWFPLDNPPEHCSSYRADRRACEIALAILRNPELFPCPAST